MKASLMSTQDTNKIKNEENPGVKLQNVLMNKDKTITKHGFQSFSNQGEVNHPLEIGDQDLVDAKRNIPNIITVRNVERSTRTRMTTMKTSARVLEKRAVLTTGVPLEQQRTTTSASEGTLAMLSKDPSILIAVYAFAGGLVIALIFLLCYMLYARRRRRQRQKLYDELYEASARESRDMRAARQRVHTPRTPRLKKKVKSPESEEARVKKVSASKESASKETLSKESVNALKEKPLKGFTEGSKETMKGFGEVMQPIERTALEKSPEAKAKDEHEQDIENVDELIKAIKERKVALATTETEQRRMERSN